MKTGFFIKRSKVVIFFSIFFVFLSWAVFFQYNWAKSLNTHVKRSHLTNTRLSVDPNNHYWLIDGDNHVYLQGISHRGVLFWHNINGHPNKNENAALQMLEDLAENGGNYVRTNVCPLQTETENDGPYNHMWERTGPGLAADGKPKFNLEKIKESYFDNVLIPFLHEANKRNIYIELTLFDANLWADTAWPVSIWNPKNNVNLEQVKPGILGPDNLTVDNRKVFMIQTNFIDKLIEKTKIFGNIIYEPFNECPFHSDSSLPRKVSELWVKKIVEYIKSKGDFLISVDRNAINNSMHEFTPYKAEDKNTENSFVVVHSGPWTITPDQVDRDYRNILNMGRNKAVLLNEDFTWNEKNALQNEPEIVKAVRMKKWLSFMAGGHHNFYVFRGWIDGHKPSHLFSALKYLTKFIGQNNIHFWEMIPMENNSDFIISHPGKYAYVLYKYNSIYLIYLTGSKKQDNMQVTLPSHGFKAVSYSPKTGTYIDLRVSNNLISNIPHFDEDLVILLNKVITQ
ncbi:MAG: hypothetical protein U5R49_00550 [Deltaproteobacteria bacterium]|nr:hypothetical protein [Deltaproteobacteria bacterium]